MPDPQPPAQDEREAFEAEYRRQYNIAGSKDVPVERLLGPRATNGRYANTHVQSKWEGWQARAALASPSEPTAVRALVEAVDALLDAIGSHDMRNDAVGWNIVNKRDNLLAALSAYRSAPAAPEPVAGARDAALIAARDVLAYFYTPRCEDDEDGDDRRTTLARLRTTLEHHAAAERAAKEGGGG
jgi:hypothetical protein